MRSGNATAWQFRDTGHFSVPAEAEDRATWTEYMEKQLRNLVQEVGPGLDLPPLSLIVLLPKGLLLLSCQVCDEPPTSAMILHLLCTINSVTR